MIYIGIDPGMNGAVASLLPDGHLAVWDTPTVPVKKGNDYLVASMVQILQRARMVGDVAAVLEQGIAMPRQASTSTFKTGRGIGLWEGALAGLGIPYELVRPAQWKKAMGMPAGSDKTASRSYAQRLFPASCDQFQRVKDDGRAEAALLAEWRRRQG